MPSLPVEQGVLFRRPGSPTLQSNVAHVALKFAAALVPSSSVIMFALTVLAAAPAIIAIYAYAGYPLILMIVARIRRESLSAPLPLDWPSVTITVPVYNAVSSIRSTLERLIEVDYPKERLQILVISDASTDGTDAIVRDFAARGVELLRLPERLGKTAAENAAVAAARGEIIVNVDATILIPPESLKPLVRVFGDPTIGMASGRDVSVGDNGPGATNGESSYVGYEMWIRDLETRAGSIVGASGCFYAIRRSVHANSLPLDLSWDFASALAARELGFRSVSVSDALCIVPRTAEIRTELTRKVRTMARGISTLFHYRALMNPFRYGWFAFMLISHKLFRWLPYLLAPLAMLSLALLATQNVVARILAAVVIVGILSGAIGIRQRKSASVAFAFAGFVVAVIAAGYLAWWGALTRAQLATWQPTPRPEA